MPQRIKMRKPLRSATRPIGTGNPSTGFHEPHTSD
jgi:hypothetical protein